ncbi:MAG TPA: hypothetical protein ENL05_01725 [Candidatus Moranbacteria bacterium]|nr:hypothetical protein [Candidatus Moranbacteria bacterium]
MSYTYELALNAFIDEISKKGLYGKIKHLTEKRIEEIATKGLQNTSRGELTHLFNCPRCVVKWYRYYKENK